MPNKCDYCGENKLCREICMEPFGIGHHFKWSCNRTILTGYNWICRDCDIAQDIVFKERRKQVEREDTIRQNKWRLERDKLLKKHGKK